MEQLRWVMKMKMKQGLNYVLNAVPVIFKQGLIGSLHFGFIQVHNEPLLNLCKPS